MHVDTDYGSVDLFKYCFVFVDFFFFAFLVNNGLLFLSDLELVVIILDLFFIRSFYCLVCCVGRGAQLGICIFNLLWVVYNFTVVLQEERDRYFKKISQRFAILLNIKIICLSLLLIVIVIISF